MQLCGSLSILWHFLSLGLEWKQTFSSPVTTSEVSKFAGILNAALSKHHLLRFKVAQLEFYHLRLLFFFAVMLSKAHLTSNFRMFGSISLSHEGIFCIALVSILATSSLYLLLLLGPYHFCPLLSPSLHEMFAWYLIFLKRCLVFPILLFSSLSLHWSLRKAFLSLLAILWISAFKWVYFSFSPLLFPWSRKCQPTPVFLPGKFQGQRSLAGYSPWGHQESDMTEWPSTYTRCSAKNDIF